MAEALTLAKKSGVDVAKVRAALLGGFAQSKILDLHGQRIIDGNFKPGFKIKLHRKGHEHCPSGGQASFRSFASVCHCCGSDGRRSCSRETETLTTVRWLYFLNQYQDSSF